MIRRSLFALFCTLIVGVGQICASINGVTVGSSTSTGAVGNVDGAGNTLYYIPLGSSYTGTYAVTTVTGGTAGTVADSGSGVGYNPATALTMYIRYDLTSEYNPSSDSSIKFIFEDLDLVDVNDPWHFYESVQFSYFDDTGAAVDLTNTLLDASDGFGYSLVDNQITYGGNNSPVTIEFGGAAFTTLVNEIADGDGQYQNEFYLRLRFGSDYDRYATNTAEKLMSTAFTSGAGGFFAVPEPGTLAIWSALALGGIPLCKRRRK